MFSIVGVKVYTDFFDERIADFQCYGPLSHSHVRAQMANAHSDADQGLTTKIFARWLVKGV